MSNLILFPYLGLIIQSADFNNVQASVVMKSTFVLIPPTDSNQDFMIDVVKQATVEYYVKFKDVDTLRSAGNLEVVIPTVRVPIFDSEVYNSCSEENKEKWKSRVSKYKRYLEKLERQERDQIEAMKRNIESEEHENDGTISQKERYTFDVVSKEDSINATNRLSSFIDAVAAKSVVQNIEYLEDFYQYLIHHTDENTVQDIVAQISEMMLGIVKVLV